jgi:hypothetical protein
VGIQSATFDSLYLIGPRTHGFCTLKVCVRGQRPDHEIAVSEHLKSSGDHSGKRLVRLVLDSFNVASAQGQHTCLVYQPLGMSFTELRGLFSDKMMPTELIQKSIQLALVSLAFMHENNVVHTGKYSWIGGIS